MSQRHVSELMTTDVVTVAENDTIDLADAAMREGHFRHVPVVSEGRLVGLITQRDLIRSQVNVLMALKDKDTRHAKSAARAGWMMTRDVASVTPETPLLQAAQLMLEKKYGCLPVVDAERRVVGILTEADFLKYTIHSLTDTR